MKTRWEFHFRARGIRFEKEYKFKGQAHSPCIQNVPFEVLLAPDINLTPPGADVAGKILITVPGRPKENEDLAYAIVHNLKEQIEFPQGELSLVGIIFATRIAENEEEQKEIGDRPHMARLTFEEVQSHPNFDPKQLTRASSQGEHMVLMAQFNAAKGLRNPTERYLGFFKVIEKAYAHGRGGNLLRALQESDDLFSIGRDVLKLSGRDRQIERQEFNSLLSVLVRIRDDCAHLREKTGYDPWDPRIVTEVEPHLNLVAEIAGECVDRHVYPAAQPTSK